MWACLLLQTLQSAACPLPCVPQGDSAEATPVHWRLGQNHDAVDQLISCPVPMLCISAFCVPSSLTLLCKLCQALHVCSHWQERMELS